MDVGLGEGKELQVVTNASNVKQQSRVVVATVGATVQVKGEEVRYAHHSFHRSQHVCCEVGA